MAGTRAQIDLLDPLSGMRAVTGPGVVLVADDAESRDRLEGVVGRHLVRFGAKDELVCSWVRTDGTQGSEQRNDADETPAETPADRPQSEES